MSETAYFWLNVLIVVAVIALLLRASLAAWLRYRGKFLVTCPETHRIAAVDVDTARAALSAAMGHTQVQLQDCSRWPERGHCAQPCLAQIADSPHECMLSSVVRSWYRGKQCALCNRQLGNLDWLAHQPALLAPDHRTVEWKDVPPEMLPEVFAKFRPLCWDCHVAETFRREHPELVIDVPAQSGRR